MRADRRARRRLRTHLATSVVAVAGLLLLSPGVHAAAIRSSGRRRPSAARRAPRHAAAHVMVLMMENSSYSDVVGSSAAPYQTKLSRSYETATSSYGVGHYSLDNYLAALTGRFYTWSVGDCSPGPGCQASDTTLADQLDFAHIPWDAFMGAMPTDCDTQNAYDAAAGRYYGVRHDPFVYFPRLLKRDCHRIQPSTRLLAALDSASPPDFVWYSPQICHDGGGDEPCATVSAGDAFLSAEIPRIQATRWYREGGVIVLTYDEGDSKGQGQGEHLHGAGNHVLTVLVSNATKGRADYTRYVNTFGMLAGIEKAYGLRCLALACSASNGVLPVAGASSS